MQKPRETVVPRHSSRTAQDVREWLRVNKKTTFQLGRVLGVSRATITRMLSGEMDGKMPVAIDLAIELYHYAPNLFDRADKEANVAPWPPTRANRALKRRRERDRAAADAVS